LKQTPEQEQAVVVQAAPSPEVKAGVSFTSSSHRLTHQQRFWYIMPEHTETLIKPLKL